MIKVQGAQEVAKKLDDLQRKINDKNLRRAVMQKGARIVVKAARSKTPVGERKTHARYNTTKLIGSRKAKKGSGKVVAVYKRGNLRGSIARLLFRKTFREWIGPKIDSKARAKMYGPGTRRFDAYYAQMLYGSARAFGQKIMQPALNSVRSKVLEVTKKQMRKVFAREVAKRGLK